MVGDMISFLELAGHGAILKDQINGIKLQLFYEKALNSKIIKKIHCSKISFEKNKLLCSTPYAFQLLCPYSKNCSAW